MRAITVTALLLGLGTTARAQEDYQVVHILAGGPTHSFNSSLIKAPDGYLYGVTTEQVFRVSSITGAYELVSPRGNSFARFNGHGILASDGAMHFGGGVRITLSGETTQIHDFGLSAVGFSPVIQAGDGYLYGTTGRDGAFARGTVYRMKMDGDDFTVVHHFTEAEQAQFSAPLSITEGSDGAFYIVSHSVPGTERGAIQRMTADGSLSLVHAFNSSEGQPSTPLLLAHDGELYGAAGGLTGRDILFRLRKDGSLAVVQTFASEGGGWPPALRQFSDGHLYFGVGGYIWRMTLAGVATPLHQTRTEAERYRYGGMGHMVEGADGNYYGLGMTGGFDQSPAVMRLNAIRVPCTNVVDLVYDGAYLRLFHFIKTETPAVWGTWWVTASGLTPLWGLVIPRIDPTSGFQLISQNFPSSGTVGVFSLLVTSNYQTCTGWKTVNTGTPN